MANQSPDRREVFLLLSKIAALSTAPCFSKWVHAAQNTQPNSSHPRPTTYTPTFFSAYEYNTIETVTEHIIPADPADQTPGAREAGVSEFIDFMVTHTPNLQYPFRTGLTWLDAFTQKNNAADFTTLPPQTRESLLAKLAYRANHSPTERQGQEFFALIREYTVLGFYTARPGLEALDYPGLRIYPTSPECPHNDDPEHTHLKVHTA